MKNLSRDGLISELAKTSVFADIAITKRELEQLVVAMLDHIKESLIAGTPVALHGFGTLKPVVRAARMAINPQTKKRMKVPEKVTVKFVPSSTLKTEMNTKSK